MKIVNYSPPICLYQKAMLTIRLLVNGQIIVMPCQARSHTYLPQTDDEHLDLVRLGSHSQLGL